MNKFLLLSAAFSIFTLPGIASSKVGDVVDLTPNIKGYVVKVNGTNHEVEIYANPDNKPSGELVIPYFYSNASSDTFKPVRIAAQGFKQCDLTSVTVGAGMEYIGKDAFYGCTKLKSFTESQPGSVGAVGEYAFYRTDALEKISLPGVYTLNQYAFNYSGIKSADFTNVEYIYAAAFYECKNLTTFVGGEKLKLVDNIAFCKDELLKQVNLGPELKSIGSMAFAFCSSLQDIVIPETCTSVLEDAFSGLALKRMFILAPNFLEWADNSKILRNKYVEQIYCRNELVEGIKDYIATGSENNKPQFLASQADVLPVSDLAVLKQVEGDKFEFVKNYGDISAPYLFNPSTFTEIYPSGSFYTIEGDTVGLQFRVDWNNILRYTVALDRQSSISDFSANANNEKVKYYDMQGREVKNPEKGIYIKISESKATKIRF